MRKKLLLTLTAFVMAIAMFSIISYAGKDPAATPGGSAQPGQQDGIEINEVNFPDPRFRKEVEQFDTIKDGRLSATEIGAVKTLQLWNQYDKPELKGLENFTALENLYFRDSNITYNNFAAFPNLNTLSIDAGSRDSIDLSQNNKLENIFLDMCGLKSIVFPDNINLTKLSVSGNQLESLDTSKFTELESLSCGKNKLSKLDLNKNTKLKGLFCGENYLKELDLSKNTELDQVNCDNNYLTQLDLTNNPKVKKLFCNNNALTQMDLSKNSLLDEINCSDNDFRQLDFSKNTKLYSIKCDNNRYLTSLDLDENTELSQLHCNNNKNLRQLKLDKNTNLVSLFCSNNDLTKLDLSKNTELISIECQKNSLEKLDLSKNTKLGSLDCSENKLKKLDLSKLKRLYSLKCGNNELETLDISNNTDLQYIECKNNQLASLDLSDIRDSRPGVEAGGNKHLIELKSDRTFELKKLPEGFDEDKASNWKGGTVKKGVLTVDENATEVTYTYDMGKYKKEIFTLVVKDAESIVTRLGGENRIKTAIEVSKKFFKSSDRVYIARHDNFPDSLTAGVLAKAYDAPILLTETRALNSDVKEEIKRLGAKYVTVIGGTDAIAPRVVNELNAMSSVYSVERIAGENRFETAAKVAEKVVNRRGNPKHVILCTGSSFADSLSISSYAAKHGYPILLVGQNKIPQVVKDFMSNRKIEKVYILGGNLAISSGVEDSLYYRTERIGGVNRYETSKLIAKEFFSKDVEKCFIASGEDFPDALVVGAPAAGEEAPIVLTPRFSLNLYTKQLLEGSKFKKVYMVGKFSAISKTVEDKVVELLKK